MKNQKFKVWWIPQVPMKAFEIEVKNLVEAKLLLTALADYDQFQLDNNIKPDYSNMGGLVVWEDGEWVDWENEEGRDIDDFSLGELRGESPVEAECKREGFSVSVFGPGRYFIGDICYALDDQIYSDVWGKQHGYSEGEYFVAGGRKFAVAGTAYGDGSYKGSDGKTYSVDAGVIGVVPEALWKKKDRFLDGGRIVEVKEKLGFEASKGVFILQVDDELFSIDTSDEGEEE